MAADRKRGAKLQTVGKKHCGEFDVKGQNVSRVERAERVEREPTIENAVPEFCLGFAENALHLMNRRAKERAEHIIELVSEANSDAGKPRRHVK